MSPPAPPRPRPLRPPRPPPPPAAEEEEVLEVESDGGEQGAEGDGKKIKRRRRLSVVDWWNNLVRATRYEVTAPDGIVTICHTLDNSDAAFAEFNANKTGQAGARVGRVRPCVAQHP